MKLSIITVCLSSLIFSSYAVGKPDKPPRWYTIETIFFEYTDPEAIHSEVWSNNPGSPDWETGESLKPVKRTEEIEAAHTQLLTDENPLVPLENPLLSPIHPSENTLDPLSINPATAMNIPPESISPPATITPPEAYQQLAEEQLTLREHYQKLLSNPTYKPLFHIGWLQTALEKNKAKAVHVTPIEPSPPPVATAEDLSAIPFDRFMEEESEVLPVTFMADEHEPTNPASPHSDWVDTTDLTETETWTNTIKRDNDETNTEETTSDTDYEHVEVSTQQPDTTDETNNSQPAAEGLLTFYRSRYLHIRLDALLRHELPFDEQKVRLDLIEEDEDSNWFDEEELTSQTFRLTEKRRIRIGKLHYFDHPLFGVLLMINRYEPPIIPEENPAVLAIPKTVTTTLE